MNCLGLLLLLLLLLINTSASVLFGLRLTHYAQSIFILLLLKLACQWDDLNICLGRESQMGFETGGEG